MAKFQHLIVGQLSSGQLTGYRNDEGSLAFNNILSFDVLPTGGTGAAGAITFAPGGQYAAVAHSNSPYVTIYRRTADGYVKLGNPSALPSGSGNGASFSPDGTYLAIAHNTSPFFTVYKRNGNAFSKLPNPASIPAYTCNGIEFSPDGTYLTVCESNGARANIYKRDGDVFTRLPELSPKPTSGGCNQAVWSPDMLYLACVYSNSPYVMIYKRNGDSFVKLPDPSVLPTGTAYGAAFSPDGSFLVVAHNASPFLTIYKRNGDTFTKLDDPAILPAGRGQGATFSSDGAFLAIPHFNSPYIAMYERSGDTFTKLGDPAVLPTYVGASAAFSPALFEGAALLYATSISDLLSNSVDLSALKLALLSPLATYNAADDSLSDVTDGGANEVYGNNWPQGGIPLTGAAVTFMSPFGAMLTLDDARHNIIGGDISASSAVIYDSADASKKPLAFIDFGGERTATSGERFGFNFSENGLILFQKQ